MPGRITELSESQIVADLLKDRRRQAAATTSVQMPQPAKDTFTVAATPATTYTLNAIPYQGTGGSSLNLSLNGVELLEGVDYTVDYTTAIVTVTATLTGTPTPADVLTADYWTTGDLIAVTGTPDTGVILADNFNRANSATTINPASDGGSWTADSGVWGVSGNQGVYISTSTPGGTRWGSGPQDLITRNLGSNAADVTVKFTSSSGIYNFIQIFVAVDKTADTGYCLRLSHGANNVQFLRANPGAAGTFGSTATITENTAQHTVRVIHDGAATLKCYYDGTLILTATDTSLFSTGTWVGLSADTTVTWDDFSAS